uniref:NFACT RNA-binding domain-containing protein n=1 Tax=Rhizochromulina marina TaxID=1034831 RepID=A0A6U1AHC6_9STRA
MVKSRFSAADVRATVRDLRGRVLGMRCVNVYDIDSKTYLFKLANPGTEKVVLLLESGVRFHSTSYARDKADMPSGFSMKLRKHIRAKRLENIAQLGIDRVVDFRFGSGTECHHIILEMYAAGNIILTDHSYSILAVLRSHKFDETASTAVNQLYPIAHATTLAAAAGGGEADGEGGTTGPLTQESSPDSLREFIRAQVAAVSEAGTKSNKARKLTLKQVLMTRGSGMAQYGIDIIQHCILTAGLNPNMKMNADTPLLTTSQAQALVSSIGEGGAVFATLDVPGQPGYIVQSLREASDGKRVPVYEDAVPFTLAQHTAGSGGDASERILEFESYDRAADEYFCKVEEQKLVAAADAAERGIKNRVEKIRANQQQRLDELERTEAATHRKAELTEFLAEDIDKVITVLRSALDSGMAWDELQDYISAQQDLGNPYALMVHALKLTEGKAVVLLEDHEEDMSAAAVAVDIALDRSAHANARDMFAALKVTQKKRAKTAEAATRVVQTAEKQSVEALRQQTMKRQLKAVRKPYWFEKFHWFITSENFLVLAGRDAQQNEQLVKRYLRPGDAYVHADMHGASSCILRNKDPKGLAPLSPVALHEAGCMTVCRSAAWSSKIFANAWWVHASQVSKTAPSGEYLQTGSFMIRGKKNYLSTVPLEMGIALLFRVDDSCLARHMNERREKLTSPSGDDPVDADIADFGVKATAGASGQASSSRSGTMANPGAADDLAASVLHDPHTSTQEKPGAVKQAEHVEEARQGEEQHEPPEGGQEEEEEEVADEERAESQAVQAQDGANDAGVPMAYTPEEGGGTQPPPPPLSEGSQGAAQEGPKAGTQPGERRGISQWERKTMKKKGLTLEQVRALPRPEVPQQSERKVSDAAPAPSETGAGTLPRGKRGKLRKVKRRYADQDEEDLALHRLAVGHDKLVDEESGSGAGENTLDDAQGAARTVASQDIARYLRGDKGDALSGMLPQVREALEALVRQRLVKLEELDTFELTALAALELEQGLQVVAAFGESDLRKAGNKSGMLAGILRRVAREEMAPDHAVPSTSLSVSGASGGGGHATTSMQDRQLSNRAQKKQMEAEVKKMLEDEGFVDAEDDSPAGSYVMDLNRLTGVPHVDDVLLFCIPVCAPYQSLNGYKFRVKLTPGTQKKGKAGKQSMDVFQRSKECTSRERDLIRMVSDNELVHSIIGDVKVSTPGLQAAQNAKRANKKKGKTGGNGGAKGGGGKKKR